jgi:fatty-acyl-CoA synthase
MKSPLTPLEFLERSAFVYPDKLAVVDGDARISYEQFNRRIQRFAVALSSQGICQGDRVAVLAFNTSLALEAHFAVPLAGGVLVMLNTRLQPSELAWILNHSGAKVLLVDPRLMPAIAQVRADLKQLAFIIDDYETFLSRGQLPFHSTPPEEDQLICINYTSGTTGPPKGVMYTHRGAYLNALGEIVEHNLTAQSVYLWTLPMFHCNGWCFPWAVTGAGARHICLDHVTPEAIVELIQTEAVTHICCAPIVINDLCQYCVRNKVRFERHFRIITAGSAPAPATIRIAEELGADVSHVYGLTEVYGPHSICAWRREWDELPLAERAKLKSRQGVPYVPFGRDMRVVDVEMNDVPADGKTTGEVAMRGNNVMLGYYKDSEATADAFRGGWFHSGDIAVMHPDGYIEIMDRRKDIVISGGENISSVEIEKVLADHPAVLDVAVIAVPDGKWGEVPKAHVTLKEGSEATTQELIDFCRERLAHFKCPKVIEFGPLPKTATGKIRKNVLREHAWAGHMRKVN